MQPHISVFERLIKIYSSIFLHNIWSLIAQPQMCVYCYFYWLICVVGLCRDTKIQMSSSFWESWRVFPAKPCLHVHLLLCFQEYHPGSPSPGERDQGGSRGNQSSPPHQVLFSHLPLHSQLQVFCLYLFILNNVVNFCIDSLIYKIKISYFFIYFIY